LRLPTLKKSSEFSQIRNKGTFYKSPNFNGFLLKDSTTEKFVLGIVASKRLGNAVERNRAKRRTREAIRTSALINSLNQVKFVLILKKTILKVPFIDLKQDIEKFLSNDYTSSQSMEKYFYSSYKILPISNLSNVAEHLSTPADLFRIHN